ncbi:hypothetical protein [Methanobrevibacter sp.]|uniref:hypothetical protein n=1 Tax=Methanobrevibacter sp. TaxID=66852 RepID=UPI0038694F53
MKRKMIFALVILAMFIGSVSAAETIVGDYKFNIPDGYEQDHSQDITSQKTDINSMPCHVDSKTFSKYFQHVTITVTSPDSGKLPDYMKSYYGGGHDSQLKGMDGYVSLDGRDYVYSYVHDGDWIVIKTDDLYGIENIIVA